MLIWLEEVSNNSDSSKYGKAGIDDGWLPDFSIIRNGGNANRAKEVE